MGAAQAYFNELIRNKQYKEACDMLLEAESLPSMEGDYYSAPVRLCGKQFACLPLLALIVTKGGIVEACKLLKSCISQFPFLPTDTVDVIIKTLYKNGYVHTEDSPINEFTHSSVGMALQKYGS